MAGPTTSLDATLTRLAIESQRVEIWVEGHFDRIVIAHLVRSLGLHDCVVNEIADLEAPAEWFDRRDVPGNRDRVLLLAAAVEDALGPDVSNFVCLVDQDHDVLAAQPRSYGPLVLPTDNACLEFLLWDESVVERVLSLYLGVNDVDVGSLLNSLRPVLEELFLIRSAQHRLRLGCHLPSARSLVTVDDGAVTLDRDEFLLRYLNTNGQYVRLNDLESEILVLRDRLVALGAPAFNGHDFVELLGHALSPRVSSRDRTQLSPPNLSRLVALALPWEVKAQTSRQLNELTRRLTVLGE